METTKKMKNKVIEKRIIDGKKYTLIYSVKPNLNINKNNEMERK